MNSDGRVNVHVRLPECVVDWMTQQWINDAANTATRLIESSLIKKCSGSVRYCKQVESQAKRIAKLEKALIDIEEIFEVGPRVRAIARSALAKP